MHTKGALGLPVNMLVVIILSLVVLGGGIALLYSFVGGAEQLKEHLDERTRQELERLLVDQGKPVALPLHTATLEPGQSHVFGLGVRNIRENALFSVEVSLSRYVNPEGIQEEADVRNWLLYDTEAFTLLEHQHHVLSIFVEVPDSAAKGQYIFNARVSADNEPYGTLQKFIVTVK